MELSSLGWDALLEQRFKPYSRQGFKAGRVAVEQKELYHVFTVLGDLPARITGKMRHAAKGRTDFPAVGDWVVLSYSSTDAEATIQTILPRKSKLSRKAAGKTVDEQILATNIDTAFIVTGLDGDFNVRRIERYLTVIWESGANPVVLLNKVDICTNPQEKLANVESVAFGVPMHLISARTGQGIEKVRSYLKTGRTAVLLGSSGAGKSTLINNLLGYERNRTQAVRKDDSRGRHTTAYRELIVLPRGGCIIDSPGIREIQVWDAASGIGETFEDVESLARECRFKDCHHENEPGCVVQEALKTGRLDAARYENYLKLRREQAYISRLQNKNEMTANKEKWRKIAKLSNQIKKAKYE
jgi:ribosome biogenesis GTPase